MEETVKDVSGNTLLDYTYDTNGNLISKLGSDKTTYMYDGNRTSKTVNEEKAQYYVVDVNSSLSQVSEKVTADGLWYYIADGHKSIRALVNADGDLTDTYNYDAFGNTLKVTGTMGNDYRYTGEEYNETTGLILSRKLKTDIPINKIIVLISKEQRYYIVASAMSVLENDLDFLELPIHNFLRNKQG